MGFNNHGLSAITRPAASSVLDRREARAMAARGIGGDLDASHMAEPKGKAWEISGNGQDKLNHHRPSSQSSKSSHHPSSIIPSSYGSQESLLKVNGVQSAIRKCLSLLTHSTDSTAPLVSPSATSAAPGAGRPAEALEHLVRFRMFDDA